MADLDEFSVCSLGNDNKKAGTWRDIVRVRIGVSCVGSSSRVRLTPASKSLLVICCDMLLNRSVYNLSEVALVISIEAHSQGCDNWWCTLSKT